VKITFLTKKKILSLVGYVDQESKNKKGNVHD